MYNTKSLRGQLKENVANHLNWWLNVLDVINIQNCVASLQKCTSWTVCSRLETAFRTYLLLYVKNKLCAQSLFTDGWYRFCQCLSDLSVNSSCLLFHIQLSSALKEQFRALLFFIFKKKLSIWNFALQNAAECHLQSIVHCSTKLSFQQVFSLVTKLSAKICCKFENQIFLLKAFGVSALC